MASIETPWVCARFSADVMVVSLVVWGDPITVGAGVTLILLLDLEMFLLSDCLVQYEGFHLVFFYLVLSC